MFVHCMSVCVRLFVCVSVRSHISQDKFHEIFLCMLSVSVVRSCPDNDAIRNVRYVLPVLWMTSRTFSRNGAKTTSWFVEFAR